MEDVSFTDSVGLVCVLSPWALVAVNWPHSDAPLHTGTGWAFYSFTLYPLSFSFHSRVPLDPPFHPHNSLALLFEGGTYCAFFFFSFRVYCLAL